jgi:hypothetical protein
MKKQTEPKDELRPEYNMKSLLKDGVRGKYASRYNSGTNLLTLASNLPNQSLFYSGLESRAGAGGLG